MTGSSNGSAGPESGQSLLEVALVTPLLLLLVMGVIDMGRYMYQAILLGDAARAAVGYAAQTPYTGVDATGMCDAASNDFFDGASPTCSCNAIASTGSFSCTGKTGSSSATSLTVSSSGYLCECDAAGGASGGCEPPPTCATDVPLVTSVRVTASSTFSPMLPYPGIPVSIPISRTATMRTAE
jgi:Flp pilus assembly protein TadG